MGYKTLQKQAVELADIMINLYDDIKYKAGGTIWETSFFWDGEKIGDQEIINPYREFIPELFNLTEGRISKPDYIIPKSRSIKKHYCSLSLANRNILESTYMEVLEDHNYYNISSISDIISDKKLATEAISLYVKNKEDGFLQEEMTLLEFLLYYDINKNEVIKNKNDTKGTFIYLTERAYLRYGDDELEEKLLDLVGGDLSLRAIEFEVLANNIFLDKDQQVNSNLTDLCKKYSAENGDSNLIKPIRRTRVPINGRRKVRSRNNNIAINWEAISNERRIKYLTYTAFHPDEVVRARIDRVITEKYLERYKNGSNIEEVLDELLMERDLTQSEEEKRVLDSVVKKFQIMKKFPSFRINHVMPVTIRRK